MQDSNDEENRLRSVALQNARSIFIARQRTEEVNAQAQEQLREAASRLQLALAAGQLGDWSWDASADLVTLGPRAAEIFGLPPGKLVTRARIRESLHEDDVERARQTIERALVEHAVYSAEYRVKHPVRGLRWVAARGLGTYGQDGSITGMIGVFQDITDRKCAEDALRITQMRLQMAIEAGQMGHWEWVLSCGKVHWSPALQVIHGLVPGTFGGTFEDYKRDIHPEDLARVLANIQQSAQTGSDYRIEYRIIKPDGSLSWIEARGKLFLDAQGNPERMAGICMDVTARKQAEEKLHEETRMLELLNQTGTVLATKLHLQALLQAVTDAATELSGAKLGAFIYVTVDEKGDDSILYSVCGAPVEAFAQFGQPRATPLFSPAFRGEAPIRSDDLLCDPRYGAWVQQHGVRDGELLPLRSYLGVPVIMNSGEVIGGLFFGHPETCIFTERTEQLIIGIAAQAAVAIENARLYEATQKASEDRQNLLESERSAHADSERANELKDEFLATLSHELRTPLNSILGWAQVLKLSATTPDFQRGLDAIERNARLQAQLIEDLLDMSRITSGKMRLDIQPVEVIPVIEAAIETVRPAAEAKLVRIEKLFDVQVGSIVGDPSRLQQVIWNLVSNAIKFTPKGGKVEILTKRVGSHIEINVADTGIGIKSEFLPYVFERFRQADATTTRAFGGLGLGLAIVKHLVELHGGTVRVKSGGPGQGTTFAVHLPITVVHNNEDAHGSVHPTRTITSDFEPSDLAGVKVLVVDDEADARELVKHVLGECEAEVITASTAAEALALIEQHRPDVLLSDIGMPNVDGYELLRRVRMLGVSRGGQLPAIALTAFARSEDRTRALRAGFLVHVAKPVEPSELVATVASVTGRTGIS
ncbi:MAG: PAS domain-containing protein [Burkholderiales bacterium]